MVAFFDVTFYILAHLKFVWYHTDQQGAIRFRGYKEWTIETVRE